MIDLTAEEWASLVVFPPFARLMHQMQKQRDEEIHDLAIDAMSMSDTPGRTAMNYATAVGRIAVMTEVLEFKPYPDTGADGNDKQEEGGRV